MVTDGLTPISVCNFAESVFPGQRCVLGNSTLEALQALEAEFFFFFWPSYAACGILVPPSRDQTHASCIGSMES